MLPQFFRAQDDILQFVVVCFVKATVPNSKLSNSSNDRQDAEFYRLWVVLLEKVRNCNV